jgi:hypothetical protein
MARKHSNDQPSARRLLIIDPVARTVTEQTAPTDDNSLYGLLDDPAEHGSKADNGDHLLISEIGLLGTPPYDAWRLGAWR